MKSSALRMIRYGVFSILLGVCWGPLSAQTETIQTGPVTENRFPPLQVPEGFRTTLFACDPLMEYPSTLARGPRLGTVFVAQDYLTGLGTEIVKRDEIRFLEDLNGDGTIGHAVDDRVAFLESRKAAAALGASDEWNKMEGVAFNPNAPEMLYGATQHLSQHREVSWYN